MPTKFETFYSIMMNSLVHKLFGSTLVLVIFSSLVALTLGQSEYDCDKYCHQSCSQYFESSSSQFSECVRANVHCSCTSVVSGRNPVIWFVLLVAVILTIAVCCGCKRHCNRGSIPAHSVVAQPVVTTVSRNYTGVMANGQNYAPYAPPAQFIAASPFIAATPSPQKPPESYPASEYGPPPPYYECAINSNTNAPSENTTMNDKH
ncbi:hypothetical protein Ocin01_01658 [Orchesella cincta]|uniref:Uncharacterized protein n=1 Tax=Orchesella cincta TaxID=48709 RepID=A0A1D2NIH0_ORCCI|nr:hypothetical protein Ocin01_01658 [Orchesella cincta]